MSRWGRTGAAEDRYLKSIHLQGIGRVPAIPAEDVKPGMLLSWNYAPAGYKIIAVRSLSPRFIEITEANRETGEVFRRRVGRGRMIAASWPKERDRARRRSRRDPARGKSDRARLIRAIYGRTPRDYRTRTGGTRNILAMGPHGTTILTLEKLSTTELERLAAKRDLGRTRSRTRKPVRSVARDRVIEQGGRMVRISKNVYAGQVSYIAVLSSGGSPIVSRTFKTEAGALKWAHQKVMRDPSRRSRRVMRRLGRK